MTTIEPNRLCPRCQSRRPEHELFCAGTVDGGSCGWDLTGVDISYGSETLAIPAPSGIKGMTCPNGHPVTLGDWICSECGADVVEDGSTNPEGGLQQPSTSDVSEGTASPHFIAGWQILREFGTAGTVRRRYAVRRPADGREAVLTIYGPGAQPDASVYDALRQRLSREHIAELIESGQAGDRAYDVTEFVGAGSLSEFEISPADTATIRRVVEELSIALAAFLEVGLRHRALHPEKILIRSLAPLDLVITGFESSRLSEADLEIESLLDVSRYTAPEAVMGAVTTASDWWGLGMMLLGLVTRDKCFAGANDQLFLIHVQANGAPIPHGLEPRLDLLLRGLLDVDRTTRWQWKEVREWLNGGTPPVPRRLEGAASSGDGPTILLGGVLHRVPRRFAMEAARGAYWSEACDLLAHGRIGMWAEELQLDDQVVANLRDLGKRMEPSVGFRLGIALQLLNPQFPLIYQEEIVNPGWLLRNPELGYELISGSVPELLPRLGIESDDWLRRLAKRAATVRARAEELEIVLDESRWEVLVLSASQPRLVGQWEQRRKEFPDAHHPSLASLMERGGHNDEDLILLLSASLDQFRSREELIVETLELAARCGLDGPSKEFLEPLLDRSRSELFAAVDKRTAGFARCSHNKIDDWADRFRLERRLCLSESILLLGLPENRWEKPRNQEYVASVLGFFEKRVSATSRRGVLVRMTIGKTTPRVDLLDMAADPKGAAALLSSLLDRSERTMSLDPMVIARENGPEGRLRNLLNKTTQYRRDTGINGAYVGFPFVLLPTGGQTKPRLSPVLLWPVTLTGEIGTRGRFSLAFDSERGGVRVNPAFEGLYGVEGTARWRSAANDLLSRSSLTPTDVMDVLGSIVPPSGRTLARLPKGDVLGQVVDNRLICCAVLFHLQFLGQSLVEDLRQLKQRPLEGTALEKMLRLAGDDEGFDAEPVQEPIGSISESDEPVLVTHSDPSQEAAIAQVSRGAGLVVQGPPGTGKSQTIVNLVADSITRGRTVLIVCQKMPALEVVRKRLVAEQLGGRIVMVTNVTSDRVPFLTEFREQLEALESSDPQQAQRREREATQTRQQMRRLEGEIDSRHQAQHVVDATSGRSYRQILGELIRLEARSPRPLPDVFGLRNLFRNAHDQDVRNCEEVCGSLAEEWLAAAYEGNPLEATLPLPHDRATSSEFQRLLAQISDAEAARLEIPTPADPQQVLHCPTELSDWLDRHRSIFARWDDRQPAEFSAFLPLFRQGDSGIDYTHILQRLMELERGWPRSAVVSSRLSEWIGTFDAARAEAIATTCEQNGDSWLAARFEGNPLAVVRLVLTIEECKWFRSGVEHLVAVEERRSQAVASGNDDIEVSEPDLVVEWLDQCEESVVTAVEMAGDMVSGLLPHPDPVEICDRYENILRNLQEHLSALPSIDVSIAPLSELLVNCDSVRLNRIAKECGQVAVLWVKARIDPQLLDAVTLLPQDQDACTQLQSAISEYVAAERVRDAKLAAFHVSAQSKDVTPGIRDWLAHHKAFIERTDEDRFLDAVQWQPLFRAEPGSISPAEQLRRRLLDLTREIQQLADAAPTDPALEQVAASLDARRIAEVSSRLPPLLTGSVAWFDWKRFLAKRRLRSWLRSLEINWNDETPHQLEESFRRETERRRIRRDLEQVSKALSVGVDFTDWHAVESEVRRITERLVAAFHLCKAVIACPVVPDRRLPLNGWEWAGLMEWMSEQQASLDFLEARQASWNALNALRPTMSTLWVECQEREIARGRSESSRFAYLDGLVSEVARLADVAAFRQQLAGCDELTPRALSALSPINESLSSLPAECLASEVIRQVRSHWVTAYKQAIEVESPLFRLYRAESDEDIESLCEKLAWAKWLFLAADACPESTLLKRELVCESFRDIEEWMRRLRAGVELSLTRQASSAALAGLDDVLDPAWRSACERAIETQASNDERLIPLRDSLDGIHSYMTFRANCAQWTPEILQAFRFLAEERAAFESFPESKRPAEIGRAIRRAYWKRRQTLTEQAHPILRQLESSSVDAYAIALQRLQAARRLSQIIDACPLPQMLIPAIQSGAGGKVEAVLDEFDFRLRRKDAVQRSLECLGELEPWMSSEWLKESRRRVDSWSSNSDRLRDIEAALPTFSAYQLFRFRSRDQTPLQTRVFHALQRIRPVLEDVLSTSAPDLKSFVADIVRRESLLAWKGEMEQRQPALLFNRNALDSQLGELRRLDREMRVLNREHIGGAPLVQNIVATEDWENIDRLRGPRARSLRQFFELGRERGLLALRPVWLMTPDVASQLLPLERAIFDLVVFDEASQMPVEHAIPCLYRARTVLISGDDKQMPPSSFFSGRLESDEVEWSDEEPLDDSASQQERRQQEHAWNRREVKDCPDLLHLGLATLPKTTLQIHYRSEYRELIAFSNAAFYQNDLGVPVRHPEELVIKSQPIEYVSVNGIYADQQNPDEARKVVDILADLWTRPESKVPSAGVVTFNLRQADLIMELLEERAETDEEFRSAYRRELDRSEGGEDMSFFVKNVENVQGDERDVIIFSTTFGRTKAGTFRRNFGALGQAGGERRLNVAVTRARRKVIIAGSMPIDEISDMLRTRRRAEVARDYLQAYLHYAVLVSAGNLDESRHLADRLCGDVCKSHGKAEELDGFKESVARFIRELGFEPIPTGNDPVLGVDFSIRDPQTGLFGVGIECDPPKHNLIRKARSREIWRHSILLRSYRALCQVSAYGWYHEPEVERKRLRDIVFNTISIPGGDL
jgi:AAA domain/Protein kinase domain/REase_MTES_1575/Protein of unknown function (DUF4011)